MQFRALKLEFFSFRPGLTVWESRAQVNPGLPASRLQDVGASGNCRGHRGASKKDPVVEGCVVS